MLGVIVFGDGVLRCRGAPSPQGSILQLNYHELAPVEERDQQTVPQSIDLDLRRTVGTRGVVLTAHHLKESLISVPDRPIR